jgi:hypothetical protein
MATPGCNGETVVRSAAGSWPRWVADGIRATSETEREVTGEAVRWLLARQGDPVPCVVPVGNGGDGHSAPADAAAETRGRTEDGIRVWCVSPGSLPDLLGFRRGDLVLSVDGYEMTSAEAALATYSALSQRGPGDVVTVRIERAGRLVDLRYRIVRPTACSGE